MKPVTFHKVRFSSPKFGATAGLVIPSSDLLGSAAITRLSSLFPLSEAMKMENLEVSPEYTCWEGALNHAFS